MFGKDEIALLENPSLFKARDRVIPPPAAQKGGPRLNLNTTANYAPAKRTPVENCETRWIMIGCGCKSQLVQSGCMRRNCEPCADYVKKRAGTRVEARLLAGLKPGEPILKTIFTVPDYLREKYADRKVWRRLLRRLVAVLKSDFGFLFGLEASHPTGDDLDEFKPHANFLWRRRPKGGWRGTIDLGKLREAWRKLLNIGLKDPLANPHHEFIVVKHWNKYEPIKKGAPVTDEKKNKLSHACSYTVRPFPGWTWWTGSIRWYGNYPKNVPMIQDPPCPVCGMTYAFQGVPNDEEIKMWKERPWAFHPMYPPDKFRSAI
jgi:hypothetical protein